MSRGLSRSAAALVLAGALGAGVLTGCGGGAGSDNSRAAAGSGGSGDAGRPRLKVTGAFIPQPVTAGMAAGFLTVGNTGGADTLTSVTSTLAARVTLHSTEGGTMRQRDSFPVPAHGTLAFTRGANHLMFEQLAHLPKVGDTVTVELHFKRSGTVGVQVPVKPTTYNPAARHPAGTSSAHPNSPSSAMSS